MTLANKDTTTLHLVSVLVTALKLTIYDFLCYFQLIVSMKALLQAEVTVCFFIGKLVK